jgi:hypothetical protein
MWQRREEAVFPPRDLSVAGSAADAPAPMLRIQHPEDQLPTSPRTAGAPSDLVLIVVLVWRPIQAHLEHDDLYERRRSPFSG